MIDKETTKTSAIKAKFTNSGKSEKGDGRSKRFSGWSNAGLTIYNVRYDAIGVNRQQNPNFDRQQLQHLVKQYGEMKDKAAVAEQEAPPVQLRHDMPSNPVAPPIYPDRSQPMDSSDDDVVTSDVDEDDDEGEMEFEGDEDGGEV